MPSSQAARAAICAGVLLAMSLGFTAGAAEKRLVRHFPTPKWCSIVSGHSSSFDLVVPHVFTPPANRVTLVFKADNAFNNSWNNQRLDDVVVLRADDLPAGTEPVCFTEPLSDNSQAIDPPAFPSLGAPAVFGDDFRTGAKPEWGSVPAGTGDGTAPAPLFWLPTSSAGSPVTTDLVHEDFEDGVGQGWTSATIPNTSALNLWRIATDCTPIFGVGHLAFGRPDPDCSYDVAAQGRVGGTYTSPPLDLSYWDASQNPEISFEHRWETSGQPQEWTVETSEDDGTTWDVVLQAGERAPSSFGSSAFEVIPIDSHSTKFRIRFTLDTVATVDSGAGWYIDDIRVTVTRAPGGSLALGRSTKVAGQLVDSGRVAARLNLTNLTPGVDYAVMARWNAVQGTQEVSPPETVTQALFIDHVFDSVPPANPALTSPTHTPGVWSQNAQVTVQWSGATDESGGAGLAGYSTAVDAAAATVPDTTLETAHGSDPHAFSSATLADGGSYYFHLRTCDFALNCSSAAHLGPFKVDRTAPSAASSLASPSHPVGVASGDPTVDVTWSSATDATSGVDGYAFAFDNSPTWVCDQAKDVEEAATGTTSATLAVGTWYFHVCTRDNAGNWSTVANRGPFPIVDTTPPVNPTLSGQSHVPNVWSSLNQVTVTWSGASDSGGTGMAGYSVAFDSAALTLPNTSIDVVHGADPHSFTSVALSDGGAYYFHLRACDQALNCSAAVHIGPFRVDQTAPGTVGALASTSHSVGTASTDPTIDVTWSAAADSSSGVDGYSFAFDNSSSWICDQAKDVEEAATGTTSPTLAPGTWYFHVCTRDNAGNWSGTAAAGPFTLVGSSTALRLHTLTPCRLVDTRAAAGPLGGPALAANTERTFAADSACAVPETARALSVNVTVVGPTAPGNLRLYPPGGGIPDASVINYSPGQTRANNSIVVLNDAREFAVRCDQATGTVQVLVDVNGYFE